jgi:ribosomal protein S18 acetylase RimI-like enzyme
MVSVHRAEHEEYGVTAPEVPVRLTTERLIEAATVMGRALLDDPLFRYILPDAAERAWGVTQMMHTTLRTGLAHGEVWTTPSPIMGVACWLPPAHPTIAEDERDAAGWSDVEAVWGAAAVARYQAFTADLRDATGALTPEPHWHLSWLCVEPRQQGRGIGSTLVRQITSRADVEGVACDLFTLAPRGVPIYAHLGFRVRRETILPHSGLRLWVMARQPHGPR